MMMGATDPVCAEPKLFVGGLRFEVTPEDVRTLFGQFGAIKSAALLTHKDSGRSKGAAMVLYTKWAAAETAQLSLNGQINELSTPRAMTVKFADPQRRQEDGMVVGVTPKKLFVGQVPAGVTSDQVRGIFAPYGEVVDVTVMPPKRDSAMGCAFVTFGAWAAAEAAMEAINGSFTFPGAPNAVAVRLADAKPADLQRVGVKRGHMEMALMAAAAAGGYGHPGSMMHMGGGGGYMMGGGGGMMGGGPAAKRQFMGAGGGMMMGGGGYPGMMGMMGAGGGGMMAGGGGQGMIGPQQPPGADGLQQPGLGGQDASAVAAAAAANAQAAAYSQGMMVGAGGGMMVGGGGYPGMMHMGAGGMMGGGGMMMGGGGGMMGRPLMGSRGAGDAALQAAKAWKLFIGQISYDLQETDLFPFFSQFGTVLELALLRLPDGRHRGCGFLTFSSQAEAEAAIASANGVVLPQDTRHRPLTVKYAAANTGQQPRVV